MFDTTVYKAGFEICLEKYLIKFLYFILAGILYVTFHYLMWNS